MAERVKELLTIYVATGNKSKLANFQLFFSWIEPRVKVEQVPEYVDVTESGKTLADNSRLKILPYVGKYDYPVISNDSGLFFDASVTEIQDPVKVKRNALRGKDEKDFSQQEISRKMFDFYRQIAKDHGGAIDCQMKDIFTFLSPDGSVSQKETTRDYQLVDREVSKYDLYHPLNSLRISRLTGKFMDEMQENEDRIDKGVLLTALHELLNEYLAKV